jgi:hypothetical protein
VGIAVGDGLPFRKVFSGHESFPLRYSWLKKGYDAAIADPGVFASEDAVVALGVGKNMVQSIRHWCVVTKVLVPDKSTHGHRLSPSNLGERLLASSGWDPYIEDEATAWLLHWNLCSTGSWAPTWYWAFNILQGTTFNQQDLVTMLSDWVHEVGWDDVALSTLRRDIECLLHSYSSRRMGAASVQEYSRCPLQGLELVEWDEASGLFHWFTGARPSLPTAVFAYSLCDYWSRVLPNRVSLDTQDICFAEGSPGRAFRLDEESVLEYVAGVSQATNGALYLESTPLTNRVVASAEVTPELGLQVLSEYYAH